MLTQWREARTPPIKMSELGRKLGLKSGSVIQKYEKGHRKLSIPLLAELSRQTGIAIEKLAWPEQLEALVAFQRAAMMAGGDQAQGAA